MTTLDDRLRARLAEIRSAAGVPHAQISLEVLYFLPKGFLDAYADLFTRAVKADGGESARNDSQQQQGALEKARGRGAKTNGKRYKKTFVVLDERALNYKTLIDKRLRILAEHIRSNLNFVEGVEMPAPVQCISCRAFLESSWKFCPRCGRNQSTA